MQFTALRDLGSQTNILVFLSSYLDFEGMYAISLVQLQIRVGPGTILSHFGQLFYWTCSGKQEAM